ncbi:hypothetical protein [Capnocytophaga granulosa]|uniref:hypothetical protein n=1 Tax=Capnocytophaga granulosa TaxID=45242 RepID=UPI0028E642D1|nr:hypothetical protein [Capnocytophaga granulosa]
MKHIIFLLLLSVYSLAFAQKKIIGNWYLFELFGEKTPVETYRLQKITQVRTGPLINFAKDKTFYSTYFDPCGLDCIASTKGTYKRVDRHYLSFHVHTFSVYGEECEKAEHEERDTDLGKYYVHLSTKGILYLIKSTGDLKQDKQLAQDAEQFDDLYPIVKYIYKHNKGITSYNPSFREEVTTYAAQVLKLAHYRVCLQFFIGRSIGNVGLVKDLDTGTYYYVAESLYVQKESKLFHFTSEELKSEE